MTKPESDSGSRNPEHVLVLGHSGFIGQRVMHWLKRSGGPDRPACTLTGLSYPELDLTSRSHCRRLAPRLEQCTSVIMLAGIKRQWGDGVDSFRRNLDMVLNLSEQLEETPVPRLVFVSSAAVYGEEVHNLAIREDTPPQPQTFYGIAKYTSERILERWAAQHAPAGLVCVRPPLVYGPGDTSLGYGPAGFVDAALNGNPITLWGDGSEQREFLFVDDLGRLLADLALSDFRGTLNAASGQSHSYADLIDILRRHVPELEVSHRERSKQKVDNAFSADRLKAALPGFRFTPLEDGLAAMLRSAAE